MPNTHDFLLKNATIINEGTSREGDLLISEGKIAALHPGGALKALPHHPWR